MNFTVAEEDKLINCVANHRILYDVNHTDYRNGLAKENAWKTIEQELGKSSEDCKKKWKFIRDGYQRFKKKNKLGSGSAPKNSKDKRHQQLLFLEDVPHRYRTEIEDATGDEREEEEETTSLSELYNKNNDKNYIPEPRVKRIKRGITNEKILKLWKVRDDKMQALLKTVIKKKDDDVELFCRHIAEVLRSLPPVYKAEAKKDIGILVSDYEIKAAQISALESKDIIDSEANFSSMS